MTLPGSLYSRARRRLARTAAAAAPALVVVALAAAPASAATTLGSTDFAAPAGACTANTTWVQGSPPAGTSYSAASAGVITQWRFRATDLTQLKLKVLHYDGTGTSYTVKASSDTATAAAGVTSTFSARVPMAVDDVLGVTATSANCVATLTSGALGFLVAGDLAAGGSAVFTLSPMTAIPVAATLEPDVDNDGYGDETQDLCPSQAATHGACPTGPGGGGGGGGGGGAAVPDTKVTKGPTQTKKSTVKFSFTSTVAGATFECRLKGKGVHTVQDKTFQPCTSPRKYKKLVPGKYSFLVRAVSATGVVDATPAKVKLVVQPR
jgi:hypothetical protein